jgi:ABC-type multidrug transport system ATPase subunit
MKIALRRLTKKFGGAAALDDVSVEIEAGRIVALLGKNGAGKSTLLRLMAGVLAPTEGVVEYDGEIFRRDRVDLRKRFAFLPDLPPVAPGMTPIRHIGMCLRLYEAHRPGVADEAVALLREFDLLPLAESPMATLSRGQTYKAALAGLILIDPEVWLFDEPFASGMDPRGLAAFRRYSEKAAGRGRTVIYSTQIVEVAEQFCDEVVILDDGRLRIHATLDELRRSRGDADHVLERLFHDLAPQG